MNEEAVLNDLPAEPLETLTEEISTDTAVSEDVDVETAEQALIQQMQTTIVALKEQIAELEQARDTQEKMLGQLSDFATLFPAVDIDTIPESVWDTVKKGTSLAAAYALYEKRAEAEKIKIERINSINSLKSAGAAGKNTANEFFTPDDVRKMSRSEVRSNFSKIKKSMSKWN